MSDTAFHPINASNPRWHDRAPYALRVAGGRPTGEYATIDEAVAAARPGACVVTRDGWWIQGYVRERATPIGAVQGAMHAGDLDGTARALGFARCSATQHNLECKLRAGHGGHHQSLQDAFWGWNEASAPESQSARLARRVAEQRASGAHTTLGQGFGPSETAPMVKPDLDDYDGFAR